MGSLSEVLFCNPRPDTQDSERVLCTLLMRARDVTSSALFLPPLEMATPNAVTQIIVVSLYASAFTGGSPNHVRLNTLEQVSRRQADAGERVYYHTTWSASQLPSEPRAPALCSPRGCMQVLIFFFSVATSCKVLIFRLFAR